MKVMSSAALIAIGVGLIALVGILPDKTTGQVPQKLFAPELAADSAGVPVALPSPTQLPTATPLRTPQPTATPTQTPIRITWDTMDGQAILIAGDGTFIGLVSSNQFHPQSICNPFGEYGNKFSLLSIRNPFGPYGNPFMPYSAYYPFSSQPPAIIMNIPPLGPGNVGYLTKNTFFSGAVDPDELLAYYGCLN